MTPEDEWTSIVEPWSGSLAALGFSFLERAIRQSETAFACVDFYFDRANTFLDLGGLVVRGKAPAGSLPGFNGVQVYTFVRDGGGDVDFVLTNGEPPNAPEPPLFIRSLMERIPEHRKSIRMKGPDDVPLVLDRHRQALARAGGEILAADSAQPLEWRWKMMEQFE